MPEINTYQQQYLPQGTYNAQSTPEQMGAGIGAAISELSDTFQRIEKDKGEVWAYKTASETYENLKKKYNDDINAIDIRDPEYTVKVNNTTANFKAQITQTTTDLMESAPSSYAKDALERHMIQNSRSLMGEAIQRQASVSAEYLKAQLDDSVLLDMQSLDQDPSNENFTRILSARSDQISRLNMAPELKMKWWSDTKRDLAKTQVLKLAQNDPLFLKRVNAQGGNVEAPKGGDGTSFGDAVAFVLEKEGGYTPSDGESGAPANFGINQRANPDIDVKNLTRDRAVQLYKDRYWNAIGGDNLPKPTAMVAFNIAVNMGVGAAKDLLKESGGDPVQFTDLAKQRYNAIVAKNPNQWKYLGGWLARADATLAAATASGNTLPQVAMLPEDKVVSATPDIAGWNLLTPAERLAATRQAEGLAGQRLAVARGELQNDIADVKTTLLGGKEYPGINDGRFTLANLTEKFGPDDGKRLYDEIEYMKKVGSFVSQIETMPLSQAQKFVSDLQPKAGEGYADKIQTFAVAQRALQETKDRREKDYMEWASNTPGTNVKPIDFSSPQKLRETFVARIPAAIAGRQSYNVDTGVFSKGEVEDFGEFLRRLNPQDQIAYLREMRAATVGKDEWYMKAMRQLSPKVESLAFAGAMAIKRGTVQTSVGNQTGEMVAQYILEGARINQGRDLGDETKSIKPLKFNDNDLRMHFWNTVGKNAFAMPDGEMSNQLAEQTLQAVKNYVTASMYRTGDVSGVSRTQVRNAVKAVTGGTYRLNSSSLFLPWGMSEAAFEQQLPVAFGNAVQEGGLQGKIPDSYDFYEYSNVGDGKYVLLNPATKQIVMGKKGAVVLNVIPPTQAAGR